MKYEHNEVHDKMVGEIVRGGFGCIGFVRKDCDVCPINKKCEDDDFFNTEKTKQAVIKYIAEEVADVWKKSGYYNIKNISLWPKITDMKDVLFRTKYPVDEQTAKEIAYAARVLLEGMKAEEKFTLYENKDDTLRPTTADAFYVYNADLVKCVTVSHEQGDDIIDIFIDNEMDINTARVFCEKLSSFLRSFGGEK